jgi:hypothetical protein
MLAELQILPRSVHVHVPLSAEAGLRATASELSLPAATVTTTPAATALFTAVFMTSENAVPRDMFMIFFAYEETNAGCVTGYQWEPQAVTHTIVQ